MKTITALTILFAATLTCLSADIPKVTSKAAKELLKHPEFKKALETVPEFTKAVLKELDKHAPEDVKPLDNSKLVVNWRIIGGGKFPQFDIFSKDDNAKQNELLAQFYDGWDINKLERYFGKPRIFTSEDDGTYYWMPSNGVIHLILWNRFTKRNYNDVALYLDQKTLKVVKVRVGGSSNVAHRPKRVTVVTPTGKKLGYK